MEKQYEQNSCKCQSECGQCDTSAGTESGGSSSEPSLSGRGLVMAAIVVFISPIAFAFAGALVGPAVGLGQLAGAVLGFAVGLIDAAIVGKFLLRKARVNAE